MKTLVIYATVEGQTRKIAHFIKDILIEKGHTVDAYHVNQNPKLFGYDQVIIGGSIHMKKYSKELKKFVVKNIEQLNEKPSLFFSVSLTMATGFPEEVKELMDAHQEFLETTGLKPKYVAHLKGAIRFSEYNYFKKVAMRMIAEKHGQKVDMHQDYEYTDWEELRKLVESFT